MLNHFNNCLTIINTMITLRLKTIVIVNNVNEFNFLTFASKLKKKNSRA